MLFRYRGGGAELEADLIAALRAGDEATFRRLVEDNHPRMVRMARSYVGAPDLAEEVAQEAWTVALRGLDGFEQRSSIRTWLLGIVVNLARRRAGQERRTVSLAGLDDGGPTIDPHRFRSAEHGRWARWWLEYPVPWDDLPAERLEARDTLGLVHRIIEGLPSVQRAVILLRDVEGFSAAEACSALGISETNQRVALHRARAKVRAALEQRFAEERV